MIFLRPAKHPILSAFLWLIYLGIAAVLAARMLPLAYSTGRLIPELTSIVAWLFVPLLIILVFALVWRRLILAICSICAVILLLFWHIGFFVPSGHLSQTAIQQTSTASSATPNTNDNYLRIMTLNTLNGHVNPAALVAALKTQKVEVLALQEVSWRFLDQLKAAGIQNVLPYYVEGYATNSDNGGINCLFFMTKPSNISTNLLPVETSAMSAADITVGTKILRFVSAHPNSPHLGGQGLWSEGLSTIASLAGYDHAYIIMGDFNATWDHAAFRSLLGDTFVDASQQAGEGFHMTYPANSPIPPLIEIDHMVYSKNAGVFIGNLATVELEGTDHFALVGTLEVQN